MCVCITGHRKGFFSRCPETAAEAQIWTKMSTAAHTLCLKNCQRLETAVFQQGIGRDVTVLPAVLLQTLLPTYSPVPPLSPWTNHHHQTVERKNGIWDGIQPLRKISVLFWACLQKRRLATPPQSQCMFRQQAYWSALPIASWGKHKWGETTGQGALDGMVQGSTGRGSNTAPTMFTSTLTPQS